LEDFSQKKTSVSTLLSLLGFFQKINVLDFSSLRRKFFGRRILVQGMKIVTEHYSSNPIK